MIAETREYNTIFYADDRRSIHEYSGGNESEYLYKDLTYKIIGCIYDVHILLKLCRIKFIIMSKGLLIN